MKKTDFFLAPFFSIFRPETYRVFKPVSAGVGVGYLLYLSLILSLALSVVGTMLLTPKVDAIVEWFKFERPGVTWTPESVVIEVTEITTMEHPDLGPVVTFDPNPRNTVTAEEFQSVLLYVTPEFLFVRKAGGVVEKRALAGPLLNLTTQQRTALPEMIPITDELIDRFYKTVKGVLVPVLFVVLIFVFFFFSLAFALVASLFGLLIAALKKESATYGRIFNLSALAVTASFWFLTLQILTPLKNIGGGNFIFFGLPILYLFLALKHTSEKTEPASD